MAHRLCCWPDSMTKHGWIIASALLAAAVPLADSRAESPARVTFEEVATRAGIVFKHTIGDDQMSSLVESTGVGCAFLDYNNDGWLDVYLANGVHLPDLSDPKVPEVRALESATDRLFRSRGDGTFEDVTGRAGILPGGYGIGVLVGDYDNDGDSDVYVTQYGVNRLYRNNGDGTFKEAAKQAGVADSRFSVGATFLDYDLDGDLDLFVGNYVEFDADYNRKHGKVDDFPGPLSFKALPDQLYRNQGDGTFTNVTRQVGLTSPDGRAMGVGSFDYDRDGRPDVFVANDAMENHLYQNRPDNTFKEVGIFAGVALGGGGDATGAMAVESGDVNGDGRIDFYVPDFTSSCLYINAGKGFFDDHAVLSGIAKSCRRHVKWGAALADFDHDRDLDLYVVMGDANSLGAHPDHLLVNDGKARFTDVSDSAGPWFQTERVGRGVARGDFDNDGRLDLLVASLNDAPALLRNTTATGHDRHWLILKLVGTKSNRDGIGARVTCSLGEHKIVREVVSGGSYCCSHDYRVHLGLGNASTVPLIEIRWPSGTVQKLENIKADQILTVREP